MNSIKPVVGDWYRDGANELFEVVAIDDQDETIETKELPMKFFSWSPCFRREAGAHGKDVRGLIRVHEFNKWEQVALCEASHEQSVTLHEELNRNTEEFIEQLDPGRSFYLKKEADAIQKRSDLIRLRRRPETNAQSLGERGANRPDRVQRRVRILEDHLNVTAQLLAISG